MILGHDSVASMTTLSQNLVVSLTPESQNSAVSMTMLSQRDTAESILETFKGSYFITEKIKPNSSKGELYYSRP
jgi:hypothetical protein